MKKFILGAAVSAVTFVFGMQTASAADISVPDNTVKQAPSPWQIRVRALGVVPRDKGHVSLPTGRIAGSDMEFSSTVVPELDISYFFTDNLAAELVLGTTYSHIGGEGSFLKGAGLGKLGKTWILPPTLTAQYHFTNFGAFKPYIGAGVNYTIFYNEKGNGHSLASGSRISGLHIKDTFGGAVQVGFDYMFDQHWGFNMDVKKLFLQPKYNARLNDATRVHGKAKLDPWLIGAGITYRF